MAALHAFRFRSGPVCAARLIVTCRPARRTPPSRLPCAPVTCLAGMADGFITVARTEGLMALYKGLLPTLIGIAPYAALNFASYDLLKRHVYNASGDK